MSPIEERVADALADLEDLLAEGSEIHEAVGEAANTNGLKPESLMIRATKELGNLEDVRAKFVHLRESRERDAALRKRVTDYVDKFMTDHPGAKLPFIPINRWVKSEFISDQLTRDIALAEARMRIARHRKLLEQAEKQRLKALQETNDKD